VSKLDRAELLVAERETLLKRKGHDDPDVRTLGGRIYEALNELALLVGCCRGRLETPRSDGEEVKP
jgi:hypothetical protein